MQISRLSLCASMVVSAMFAAMTGFVSPAVAGCSDGPAKEVDWADCRKRNLILRGTTLTGSDMHGTDLTSTDLRDTNLDGADLTKANLLNSHLSGSSLVGANLSRVVGFRSMFHDTDLTQVDFEKSEMQRAEFDGSILHDVNFDKAELGRATFAGATLSNVNFDFAILARTDFRDAKLDGPINLTSAYLYLTRFEGLDLSAASGLVQAQLDLSCGDDETVLPEGLTSPASWPCDDETVN